jgi:hypothetical protein
MSQTLTTKLPDEIYEVLQRLAPNMGVTVEELAIEWVERHAKKPSPQLADEAWQAAWEHLQRHMGVENLGYPTGTDNESIDADLAKEYGETHNGGT